MLYPRLHENTQFDWGITTVKQKHAYDRELIWPRGKLLGGCSNVNAMIVGEVKKRVVAIEPAMN